MALFEALKEWFDRWRAVREARKIGKRSRADFRGYFTDRIEVAMNAGANGDFVQAARIWQEMHDRFPYLSVTSEQALTLLIDMGRYDEAEELIRQAGKLYPRERKLYTELLARIAFKRGDFEEALRRLKVLRRGFPLVGMGYTTAASCLTSLGRDKEAVAMIDLAVRVLPNDVEVRVAHARYAVTQRDWNEALVRWAAVKELDDNIAWRCGLVQGFLELGRLEEAEQLAKETELKYPFHPWAWVDLATIAVSKGDLEEAARRWETARRRCPYYGYAHIASIDLARKRGREAEAEEILSVAVTLMRFDLAIHLDYARCADRRGDREAAAVRWALVHERFPDCDEARERVAEAQAAAGEGALAGVEGPATH